MRYVLLPGAGGTAFVWHRVVEQLTARGLDAVAVEFVTGDGHGLSDYADAAVAAAEGADDVVLVAQSMGGFAAAVAAQRLPVSGIVFLNAMIPVPGESAGGWWEAVGHDAAMRENDIAAGRDPDAEFDIDLYFFHDVPEEERDALEQQEGEADSEAMFAEPCDFPGWPDVPLTVIAGDDDRLFPAAFQERVARERLSVDAHRVPGGHLAALSHPEPIVELLLTAGRTAE